MRSRAEVSAFLAGYYTGKIGGKVWSAYDEGRRKYYIRGEHLPAHPDMQGLYPNGWSLLDYVSPIKARALMARATL